MPLRPLAASSHPGGHGRRGFVGRAWAPGDVSVAVAEVIAAGVV